MFYNKQPITTEMLYNRQTCRENPHNSQSWNNQYSYSSN